jgi:hypothetical protein
MIALHVGAECALLNLGGEANAFATNEWVAFALSRPPSVQDSCDKHVANSELQYNRKDCDTIKLKASGSANVSLHVARFPYLHACTKHSHLLKKLCPFY